MTTTKKTLVLGMGRSGTAAAELLLRQGRDPVCLDEGKADRRDPLGRPCLRDVPTGDFDEAVVSPGVPFEHPWMGSLRVRRIPCVSELEFGWRACQQALHPPRTLAVTGSLGKSTVVTAAVEVLRAAGFRAAAAGNIGRPVSDVARSGEAFDWLVLEVSSFQLETTRDFAPDAAVLLNIFDNHLDRHGTLDRYTALKLRLFEQMPPRSPRVVPGQAPGTFLAVGEPACRIQVTDGVVRDGGARVGLGGSIFDDPVLGANAAALAAVMLRIGIEPAVIERGLRAAPTLPHRLQVVAERDGVRFVDDSKSTCLGATVGALRRCGDRPVRLIAGGRSKTRDFRSVVPALAPVRAAYLIGEAGRDMAAAWDARVPCRVCGDLAHAVAEAEADSVPGETILLSPGCASFDQYTDFEDRGRAFEQIVRGFAKKEIELAN